MLLQQQTIGSARNIIFVAALVIFLMWLLKPNLGRDIEVPSQKYYTLGLACLNDFEKTAHKTNHKLTNTYAKKVSNSKNIVLIRAQNQRNSEQVQIECIYDTGNLLYLSVNDQKLDL